MPILPPAAGMSIASGARNSLPLLSGGTALAAGATNPWLLPILGITELLGGLFSGEPQGPEPFQFPVDPQQNLERALNSILTFGRGIEGRARQPVRLRSAFAQPVGPINVPGIPFQIGGGLGTDPAFLDRTLLETGGLGFTGRNIFPSSLNETQGNLQPLPGANPNEKGTAGTPTQRRRPSRGAI